MKRIIEFLKDDINKNDIELCAPLFTIRKDKDSIEEYSNEEKTKILKDLIDEIIRDYSEPLEETRMIAEFEPFVSYDIDDELKKYIDFSCIEAKRFFEYLTLDRSKPLDFESTLSLGYSVSGIDPVEIASYYINPYSLKYYSKDKLLFAILYELTFFGFDLETIRNGIKNFKKRLDDAIKETKEKNKNNYKDGEDVEEFLKDILGDDYKNNYNEKEENKKIEFEISENKRISEEFRKNSYEFLKKSDEYVDFFM